MNALDIIKAAAERASLKSRPAQRDAAQAEKAKSNFEEDFNLVDKHFGLDRCGERELALDTARNDIASARICFSAISTSLRGNNPAASVTERILARAKLDKEEVG